MASLYEIVPLSRLNANATDETSLALARKFREIRLHSLQTDPEAFASSYEFEVKRGLDQSLERLSNPKAVVFIAVPRSNASVLSEASVSIAERLLQTPWVGFVGLIGPDEGKPSVISAKSDPYAQMTATEGGKDEAKTVDYTTTNASNEPQTWHYVLNGMYVSTEARNCGLGKRLVNAAVDRGHEDASKAGYGLDCSVLVDSENPGARVLYERAGFVPVGEEDYEQKPRELLGESQRRQRVAIRLALRRGPRNASA